jgi:MFS family permease
MIWVLLAGLTAFAVGLGVVTPMWSQFICRIFPARRRGLFFSLALVGGGLGGLAGGYYASRVLSARAFPGSYAHLFLATGLISLGAVLIYGLTHETVPPPHEEEEEDLAPGMWGAARRLWQGDHRLRRYISVRAPYEFGFAATSFFAVYAIHQFRLPVSVGGGLVMASSVGGMAAGLLVGQLGDRRGYRRVMAASMVTLIAATSLGLFCGPRLFYLVFFLGGAAGGGDAIANLNLLVEMSEERTRGYYYALYGTLLAAVRLLAPLCWGWVGDAANLRWAFAAGLALQVLGLVTLLARVDDPRRPGQRLLRWRPGTWRPRLY